VNELREEYRWITTQIQFFKEIKGFYRGDVGVRSNLNEIVHNLTKDLHEIEIQANHWLKLGKMSSEKLEKDLNEESQNCQQG
jgi:hypothetical protein